MIRRLTFGPGLLLLFAVPVAAQFVVFDPTSYANALLRYDELQQQLEQLVTTYEQIRTQYLLLEHQAQRVPVDLEARYRSLPTPWQALSATTSYGTTSGWIGTANTGQDAGAAFASATQPLRPYAGTITQLSADEAARVRVRYDRLQLADGTITHGLEALGRLRSHQDSVETTLEHLEEDAYTTDPDFHTQIAVLNKINATAVTAARVGTDTNDLLVSLLEQQLNASTDRREAAVERINAHIAFLTDAGPLLARTTAETTTALTTFRIP
jgi:hypothetical protein